MKMSFTAVSRRLLCGGGEGAVTSEVLYYFR